MGMKANFVFSIVALVIAVVGCVLAVRVSFFQPAPLSEEKITAMIEEKTETYITKAKKIVEEAVSALKSAVLEEGGEE